MGDDRRAPVMCVFGALVLLAVLGAAGPGAPVTAVTALPPPDTTAFGATGRLPDPTPVPLSDPPPSGLPTDLGSPAVSGSGLGIPETVLAAYRSAATTVDRAAPGCALTWPLVAGVGKVESGHASGGAVDADGTTLTPILGLRLTGTGGNAAIADSDGGALDHDGVWDRAVGPTQFIPSSWRTYGADGNGDGRADPDNVFDAGLATARYLCAGGGHLASADGRHDAVFRYNHSEAYVATVLRWADAYASGALPVPDSPEPTWTGETLADSAPTLAALPEPSPAGGSLPLGPAPGRVPTAGGPAAGAPLPAGAGPVITTSGATRPGTAATRPPGPDHGLAVPVPALPASGTTTPAPTGTAPSVAPPVGTTSPATTLPATTLPATTLPATTLPATTLPGTTTPGPTPPSNVPRPASAVPPSPRPAKPPSSAPASSPLLPSSTPAASSTTPTVTPAARCTAAISTTARALGVSAAQVTATSASGPGAGRTTCTLRGPQGPLLVAVTAAAGAPAPPTPAAGVSRAVAGGRTVLIVPPTAGVPADRARTALGAIAGTRLR